jgi:hypothetical protein
MTYIQYANSPRMVTISQAIEGYLDQSANIDAFYNVVWNIDTAQGFGLDIWGRIVGLETGRFIQIAAEDYFGFNTESGAQSWQPFNQGTFYTGPQQTQTYSLSDPAFRTLILAKALANIVRCTAPAINQVLNLLFPGRGNCYVNDLGNMQMRYTFEFPLQPWELAVLVSGIALPRPAGVMAYVLNYQRGATFGFKEAGDGQPFNQGTFLSEGALQSASA